MEDKHLHIISFSVPYPPNYGGVIDVYYKIKALQKHNIKIHLHCFQYDREPAKELEELCEKITYYNRKKIYGTNLVGDPYIVKTRKDSDLLKNLIRDDNPILFEGIHTCAFLDHEELKDRLKMVRMHNVEWEYYWHLGKVERNLLKKFYFYTESKKLKRYETILKHADTIFAISSKEFSYLNEAYENVEFLPAFHPSETVESATGKGDYALYHGNLDVNENNKAAVYLCTKVFNDLDIPLIIAGLNPPPILEKLVKHSDNVSIRGNLSATEMEELIKGAHVNILPTFQSTGMKLKLLHALYTGRFCLVNDRMVEGTNLDNICIVRNSASEMKTTLSNLFKLEFSEIELAIRKETLADKFNNYQNASYIVSKLYN